MSDQPFCRRAVVTGAGRGIGRAIALDLLAGGGDVLALARSEADLNSVTDEAAARRGGTGPDVGTVTVAAVDVRDAITLEATIATFEPDLLVDRGFGARDCSVAEAGVGTSPRPR